MQCQNQSGYVQIILPALDWDWFNLFSFQLKQINPACCVLTNIDFVKEYFRLSLLHKLYHLVSTFKLENNKHLRFRLCQFCQKPITCLTKCGLGDWVFLRWFSFLRSSSFDVVFIFEVVLFWCCLLFCGRLYFWGHLLLDLICFWGRLRFWSRLHFWCCLYFEVILHFLCCFHYLVISKIHECGTDQPS